MTQNSEARKLLVDMLHEAAELEHCLLDAYLYAACSLKTMPDEFAMVGGRENRRRAIQFERVRFWKQTLLTIAHEEMLHLHYVQCLLRALGESPWFRLPNRNNEGNWFIPNWTPLIENKDVKELKGVQVLVESLSERGIRRFVLYESSDSLQAANPFGNEILELMKRLKKFELDFYLERVLLTVEDEKERDALKRQLTEIFTALTPHDHGVELISQGVIRKFAQAGLPGIEEVKFQSLADFYKKGILPLYEEAFRAGAVKYSNLDLANEQQNPKYAQEGFLPIGPVPRSDRFKRFYRKNIADPMRHYKNVRDVINEIVEEGEGVARFEERAELFLEEVEKQGGPRAYLQQWMKDQQEAKRKSPDPSYKTPAWLEEAELARQSHLYRFAMIMMELNEERSLSQQSDVDFQPTRSAVAVDANAELKQLAQQLPQQFNACYLVLVAWLSRMYEIRNWEADTKPVLDAVRKLRALGATVILLVHPPKSGNSIIRGTGNISQKVDIPYLMEKQHWQGKDIVVLSCPKKNRFGSTQFRLPMRYLFIPTPAGLRFLINEVTDWKRSDKFKEKESSSEVIQYVKDHPGTNQEGIQRALHKGDRSVRTALSEAKDNGLLKSVGGNRKELRWYDTEYEEADFIKDLVKK